MKRTLPVGFLIFLKGKNKQSGEKPREFNLNFPLLTRETLLKKKDVFTFEQMMFRCFFFIKLRGKNETKTGNVFDVI